MPQGRREPRTVRDNWIKLSPATIVLSKRMDREVLSLSREDVLFYTSATTRINLLSERSHLLN